MRFIRLATWRLPIETPSRFREVAQHPAARKRVAEMQFVEAAHMVRKSSAEVGRGL